jgi:signal transduction histidine kinase
MQRLQGTQAHEAVTTHARFLASVSRHFMSLELDPMLEAVARAALSLLGDVCVIDRLSGSVAVRLLEVRNLPETNIEAPKDLASVIRGEIRVDANRSRMTVPIGAGADRFGTLSFAARKPIHGPAELALAQELADRLAMAIRNVQAHLAVATAIAERDRLISIAAHELRGPSCSLRLCVEALKRDGNNHSAKNERFLEIMAREERRLSHLIDDLLDFSRIRSGQLPLDLAPVDLCDVVREVVARAVMAANRPGSIVEAELSNPTIGLWDRSRLDQVVSNLVANAFKFGQQRPIRIRVSTDVTHRTAVLSVTDQGSGIDAELQQRIFEPFKRGPVKHQVDGLGLGLYIVRGIVGQFGGGVRVQSAPGHGSTFTVELPMGDAP